MKKIKVNSPYYALMMLLGILFFLSSCNKENDPSPAITNEANAHVNNWIEENMKYWYLWNDKLPSSTDKNLAPNEYYKSLLYSGDRFSWIQENYKELLNSLKGINKEAGYEFVLYKEAADNNNVIAQILYVKPNSPASVAGLLRGDVISHINDQQLTISNYKDLIGAIKENHTIKYKSVDAVSEIFSEPKTASLSTVEYSENPSFMNKVIATDGGRKVGYYVYNLFAGGPDNSSTVYDDTMDQIFTDFKSQGITDLVLDLRFNSGGAETSANNLASLIGTGVTSSTVFARREYNAGVVNDIIKDEKLGEKFLKSKFISKSANVGSQLTGNRVYVLTSSRSASASELVINALKPFMDVFIIGDTTYGKNVGSISLYDEKDPKNTWGMQPIVVKVYNSLDQSDYSLGFVPNVLDKDRSLYLHPLGDIKEALLGHAIGQITGTATTGRVIKKGEEKEMLGHSLDGKRGSYNLVIDQSLFKK